MDLKADQTLWKKVLLNWKIGHTNRKPRPREIKR